MEKFTPERESPETSGQREYVRNRREAGSRNLHHRADFMSDMSARNRFRGCLSGLAVGDALGTTLEFKPPGSFDPIDDVVGGGPFDLQPGQWTDDTSMALCLATSLVKEADSTREIRLRATCVGGAKATSPPRERASTSGTPPKAPCRDSRRPGNRLPAPSTRILRGMDR